jgi:hypothetical protein
MEFFSHKSIRKYTLALLDTFNDIYVERIERNDNKTYYKVPITFGSKDKAFVLNQKELDQWLQGNFNILPRMSLSLLTMTRDYKRDTNRLHEINKTKDGETFTFQYNAVAYTFTFELAVACRSMSELTMVLEQILPSFNPSVRLVVKEMELHEEPTSIPVNLISVDLDLPNNISSDDDIRIVGATLILELKGNIYQPFKDASLIEMVRLYFNPYIEDIDIKEERRSIKYEFSVDPETKMMEPESLFKTDFDQLDKVEKNPPSSWYLLDQEGVPVVDEKGIPVLAEGLFFIEGSDSVSVNSTGTYTLNFIDVDDEDYFIYIWNVLSGNASIQSNNKNPVTLVFGEASEVVLQAQIVDHRGNISDYTTKTIQVI